MVELKRRYLPSRLFWASYPGIAIFGIGGALALAGLATAMLLFRSLFDPWMPVLVGIGLSFLTRSRFTYIPDDYVWVVGWVYAMAISCLGAGAYAAYVKPSTDRKVDTYLQRKMALDDSHVGQRIQRKTND